MELKKTAILYVNILYVLVVFNSPGFY